MSHPRDYSEEVAALVDEEVKKLIENAHNEAWEILVENRDVLDALVLQLLEKETLSKEQIAEVFAPIVKRPARPAWTGSSRRTPSTRPPVLSPKELSLTNGANGSAAAIATATESVPATDAAPEDRTES
jgi:cell division protease FtsH